MSDAQADPSLGHNSDKREKVVWERWTKKRTFVRAPLHEEKAEYLGLPIVVRALAQVAGG